MCGIAGVVDLRGEREIEPGMLEAMASALVHRGPDEGGIFSERGVGLASRRLSIVGIEDGQQPVFNEDRTVVVIFNGELFDYPERRAELQARGHRFRTSCDTEILVHLWEELGESMVETLRGQFAFALYDRTRRQLILARDRIGIAPLHWARRGEFIYFGSEIKAILATGQVTPEADPRGIDHIFTFFAMGTRRTAFREIQAVHPASYLRIDLNGQGEAADVTEHAYWDLRFPESSEEYDRRSEPELLNELDCILRRAVEIRLRADVPVVGYLSGGVDSTIVMLTAAESLGRSIPAFTIRIPAKGLDETDRARLAAEQIGSEFFVTDCGSEVICEEYPHLIVAAEAPVTDTACAALYRQAREVHRHGYKVALTGEGADDWLAGYPWFKAGKFTGLLDGNTSQPSNLLRRMGASLSGRPGAWTRLSEIQDRLGGPSGLIDFYSLVCLSRQRFYSRDMWDRIGDFTAFDDLQLDTGRLRRWHPLNRALYLGYKTMLSGLLMNQKGDRPAMAHSVETRYPFLDEAMIEFCAKLPPQLKLRGLLHDKYLLRRYARGRLPGGIANRRKAMFRAPFASTFFQNPPKFVEQLLSEESLRRTGYFDTEQVHRYRKMYTKIRVNRLKRISVEMGLTGVMATQLWHHTFLGGGLCELPHWTPGAHLPEQRTSEVVALNDSE